MESCCHSPCRYPSPGVCIFGLNLQPKQKAESRKQKAKSFRQKGKRRKLKGFCMTFQKAPLQRREVGVRLYFKLPIISSGRTHWSNCSLVSKPKPNAASRNERFSFNAFLAILAAFSYPICGFKAVTSIREFSRCFLIPA